MNITAFDLAQRFVGVKEVPGALNNPQILAMLQLDNNWPQNDEVPWCSGFVNYICWMLPPCRRSKNLAAKSWLDVGRPVTAAELKVGWDVVVLGETDHVGFYAGLDHYPSEAGWAWTTTNVILLGGNQGDMVKLSSFSAARVVGMRRLYEG